MMFSLPGTKEKLVDRRRLVALQREWRAPKELIARSVPRDVQFTRSARTTLAGLGACAVLLILGAVLAYPGVRRDADALGLIRREGVAAHGTVSTRERSDGKGGPKYRVTYAYDAPGGHYVSTAPVKGYDYAHYVIGAWIPIHYARSRPDLSIADDDISVTPWFLLWVISLGLVLVLIPIPFTALRQRHLLAWGAPAGAVVIRTAPGNKGEQTIRYQFLDPRGELVTGRNSVANPDAPNTGDVITIVYDPDRPRRNAPFPMRIARLAT